MVADRKQNYGHDSEFDEEESIPDEDEDYDLQEANEVEVAFWVTGEGYYQLNVFFLVRMLFRTTAFPPALAALLRVPITKAVMLMALQTPSTSSKTPPSGNYNNDNQQ